MWYDRGKFLLELAEFGVQRETCTEKQCMQALRVTSAFLRKYQGQHPEMKAYAGPQCYPQLLDDRRFFANDKTKGKNARGKLSPKWRPNIVL